jgi:hypothetical protein
MSKKQNVNNSYKATAKLLKKYYVSVVPTKTWFQETDKILLAIISPDVTVRKSPYFR